jgi:hypothetical protein
MWILVTLVIFALIALAVVSAINHAEEKERERRFQQRKLKIQLDSLTDLVNGLEQTIANTRVLKYINDEIILLLNRILQLEKEPSPYLINLIRVAVARSDDFAQGTRAINPNFQKDTDTQITQSLGHITDAIRWMQYISAQGRFSEAELENYLVELNWAHLMVSVVSYIAQGTKLAANEQTLLAEPFFQKAQNLLIDSMHQDSRRLKLIRELGEVMHGTRKYISVELISAH